MNIFAIISEYNPFHNGHKYMLQQLRQAGATHTVAVMGGPFLQRGEPALFTKQARAHCALLNGVDLVIELPAVWAVAGAHSFAWGGVAAANALGCIDALGFGSECGNLQALTEIAKAMESTAFSIQLKAHLAQGKSYARAMCEAMGSHAQTLAALLSQPNNTLAIEYICALNKLSSAIKPFTVKRLGAGHDSKVYEKNIASASYIRQKILEKDASAMSFVPENCRTLLKREITAGRIADTRHIERAILYKLRSMAPEDFATLPDVSEGLENRIYEAVRKETSLSAVIDSVKTKRYTHARIRRIMLCAFLEISSEMQRRPVPYIRVLGFNEKGTQILKKAKNTAILPVIMKVTDHYNLLSPSQREMLDLDLKAADLQALAFEKIPPCGQDFYTGTVRV